MDLFGGGLPDGLKHRFNYGLQLYFIGQVMAGQSESKAEDGSVVNSDPIVNPKEAKQAAGLVEMAYYGIHNLDISQKVQVPHELLLALNPSQIFELYAGAWLLKMDDLRWDKAVNRHNFWQVVGAARAAVSKNLRNRALLAKLDDLCGQTYSADEDGNLPARLRQLPQYVADGFMQAFTSPFISPNSKTGYMPARQLKTSIDQVVFGHFANRFAEGERQLSLPSSLGVQQGNYKS